MRVIMMLAVLVVGVFATSYDESVVHATAGDWATGTAITVGDITVRKVSDREFGSVKIFWTPIDTVIESIRLRLSNNFTPSDKIDTLTAAFRARNPGGALIIQLETLTLKTCDFNFSRIVIRDPSDTATLYTQELKQKFPRYYTRGSSIRYRNLQTTFCTTPLTTGCHIYFICEYENARAHFVIE